MLDIKRVTYLQQKSVGVHTNNILFSNTSAENYKHTVLTDVEHLHATTRDYAHCITSIPINPKHMIHIKCDLIFVMNVLSKISPTQK